MQRVAIARALAMKPKVMLFDKPTSSLDPEMVKEVLDEEKLVEDGAPKNIFCNPQHRRTQAFLGEIL